MFEQLLKDSKTDLTEELFKEVLGESYATWKEFNKNLTNYDISLEWRHYKDGGWLAKCTHKKKTIIWGSLSEGFFSLNFIFSEKPHLREGLLNLDISEDIKKNLLSTPKGTYFSACVDIYQENQLSDIYKLIDYKKDAK